MSKHRFVWHDLNTKNLDASKQFYGEIFNWKFESSPNSPYVHISAGSKMIGGMRQMEASEPYPTSWLAYVNVDDVAATVKTIESAGGKVHLPTTSMPNVGTFAVTADPSGAVFAPWKSARASEDEEKVEMPAPYTFVWDELVSQNPESVTAFYTKVFGWQPRTVPMGPGETYTLFDRPGIKNFKGDQQSAGGMMKSPPGVPYSFWLPYIAVENADKICERATRLGATVTVGPMDIPNVGRFACWLDPQQASIAVLQPKM